MIPSKHANALYFTPRTPWGTRVQRRALQNHMQASENKILGAVKKGAQWVGDHVFFGAEGEKNPGDKLTGSVNMGVNLVGKKSFGDDEKEQRNEFIEASHGHARMEGAPEMSPEVKAIEKQRPADKSQRQKETDTYVNRGIDTIKEGESLLKKMQSQARPAR